jgi:hypothetical protein
MLVVMTIGADRIFFVKLFELLRLMECPGGVSTTLVRPHNLHSTYASYFSSMADLLFRGDYTIHMPARTSIVA